jgi:hypothetical protein
MKLVSVIVIVILLIIYGIVGYSKHGADDKSFDGLGVIGDYINPIVTAFMIMIIIWQRKDTEKALEIANKQYQESIRQRELQENTLKFDREKYEAEKKQKEVEKDELFFQSLNHILIELHSNATKIRDSKNIEQYQNDENITEYIVPLSKNAWLSFCNSPALIQKKLDYALLQTIVEAYNKVDYYNINTHHEGAITVDHVNSMRDVKERSFNVIQSAVGGLSYYLTHSGKNMSQ